MSHDVRPTKITKFKRNHISPALVGANVTAVEGLAIGEADGPDGALALPMTFLMTLLPASAMYIMPEVVSIATPKGWLNVALVACPPSPP